MTQKEVLITFILLDKHPTTYQLPDGSFSDSPIRKRIIPEYDKLDQEGNATRCRHIRNAGSIEVAKQGNSVFNNRTDNIYFSNGICILSSTKDVRTVEFLRNHPMNSDNPDYTRNTDVFPAFREVKGEIEGITEIDKLMLIQEARNIALSLRRKDGSYDSKLKFLSTAFKLDGSLEASEQVVALVAKAEANPTDFIHHVNAKWEEMEVELDQAIKLNVVSFNDKVAFLMDQAILSSDEKIEPNQMKSDIMSLFLSDAQKHKELKQFVSRELELQTTKKAEKKTESKKAESKKAESPELELKPE